MKVTVFDPSGGVIPGAELTLLDPTTNDARKATTQEAGYYDFVNLNLGTYKLTVSKSGFETQAYTVVVQAGRTADLRAVLKVGVAKEVVEVSGSTAPLVETVSNATAMTITTEQIENLPLSGRDITSLSRLAAGYNGTWNGLPTMAWGSNIDGVIATPGRWKYGTGAATPYVSPRIENMAEMTVQTNQMDMNQGFGTSNMQINLVTRRGSNTLHGRIYEDHRNAALNATNWAATPDSKASLILNEFGGSAGGAIIKDKLFFFGVADGSETIAGGIVDQHDPAEPQRVFENEDDVRLGNRLD